MRTNLTVHSKALHFRAGSPLLQSSGVMREGKKTIYKRNEEDFICSKSKDAQFLVFGRRTVAQMSLKPAQTNSANTTPATSFTCA